MEGGRKYRPLLQEKYQESRFEREAKLLASLNHSNIVAIYGLEQGGEGGDGAFDKRYHVG